MGGELQGISDRVVAEMPVAVFDMETTGLTPGLDRVVELSIIRKEPGGGEMLVLDTLVNPKRPVAATEIHGITDEDVADAPEFQAIVSNIAGAISDCVLAAYNVYFDMAFLKYELTRAGMECSLPHFCLMYLRPMLGLGKRCALGEACAAHGIHYETAHLAAADVQAAVRLMGVCFEEMRRRRIATFGDLARLKSYKFVTSFECDPLALPASSRRETCRRLKPRGVAGAVSQPVSIQAAGLEGVSGSRQALGAYWDALRAVICDLEITDDEVRHLRGREREFGLRREQVRALHARAFVSVTSRFVDDQWLDEKESTKLRRLYRCLSQLGWAPGE